MCVLVKEINETVGRWIPKYETLLLITEFFMLSKYPVSENSTSNPFFIELFALDEDDHGAKYSDELKIVRFLNGTQQPDWDSAVSLDSIPDDGFIVICNEPASDIWGDSCTKVIEGFEPTNETVAFALINGYEDLGYNSTDTFGYPGTTIGEIKAHIVSYFESLVSIIELVI